MLIYIDTLLLGTFMECGSNYEYIFESWFTSKFLLILLLLQKKWVECVLSISIV